MIKGSMKRCIITVGKPDAHKEIHFGHLSGGLVCADIYARFLRRELGQKNVLFLSGSECYGSAVETAFSMQPAQCDSILEYVKKTHNKQAEVLTKFQIEFNDFFCDANDEELHTIHTDLCQKMVDILFGNSHLLKKQERILTEQNGRFLNYREISLKTSSKGKYSLNELYYKEPIENLISKRTGESPIETFEENYFLDFSKRESSLRQWFSLEAPEYIEYLDRVFPQKTTKSPICVRVTSNTNWGIDVTIGGEQHKLWVWIDSILAPLSYTIRSCKNVENAYRWWCETDSKIVHYIAEDNLKFYCALESYLLAVWNDSQEDKIKLPQLKLTPMRTVKSEYGLPGGDDLLTYYSPEQIRYSIASMGDKTTSFQPLRYNTREMIDDNISCRCDSLLKKIENLVKKAEMLKEKSPSVKADSDAVTMGEQIYCKYYCAMCEQKTHRAVDIIEENLKHTANCGENAIYYAELFLYMLYPILPNYSIEKYCSLLNNNDILGARKLQE